MHPEKVIFGFFIVLAMTLNFGFFIGELDNPEHHHVTELLIVIIINFIATGLKLGDRTHIGAVLLSTSLVADLELAVAAGIWVNVEYVAATGLTPEVMAIIVSLSGGALLANMISVIILVADTLISRR